MPETHTPISRAAIESTWQDCWDRLRQAGWPKDSKQDFRTTFMAGAAAALAAAAGGTFKISDEE